MRILRNVLLSLLILPSAYAATGYKLIAWNDLGMHCTDGVDYSVFGILPPYNTVNAQLIGPDGRLVRVPGGVFVTYEAMADANGSINTTSIGKTNFWSYTVPLFGVTLAPDSGLAGTTMPGAANTPRVTTFDANRVWFSATGVPITPFDDNGAKNYYPMMRFVAKDAGGNPIASASVVMPVSDEMDCRSCHASGSSPAARPAAGWIWHTDPVKDVKLNVLAIHDQHQGGNANYRDALAKLGYDPAGLRATVAQRPILCASCHSSNALPGLGVAGIQPLTRAIHSRHADSVDPTNGLPLDSASNRGACYRCHPGAETKCLRGAMGASVAANGDYAMQCQSCHGSMSMVGGATRNGWLEEPLCQSCHTGGTRYTSCFVATGVVRAGDARFATNANQPAAGLSLYRFSTGHGGLQCEACHNSTHAELATSEANDNVQSIALQGHAGVIAECTACHASMPLTTSGGPHGLHPLGSSWVSAHGDIAENNTSACRACHGDDLRGSELSRALGPRSISSDFGTKTFWRGFQVGCWACHDGPSSEHATQNRAPSVANRNVTVTSSPATIALSGTDPDFQTLTLRIVSQPKHGRVGLSGTTATFFSDASFTGADSFTYAAWDGYTNSNLGTVTLDVTSVTTHAITVAKNGSGSGVVTSAPAGINCGTTCSASFASGANVTLSAQADPDSHFDGWSGACSGTGACTIALASDATVIATFTSTPSSYTLTVTKSGTGAGTVTSDPSRISCGATCSGAFTAGTIVTLTATPSRTASFNGWSGACSGTGKCIVTMDAAKTATATFTRKTKVRAVR